MYDRKMVDALEQWIGEYFQISPSIMGINPIPVTAIKPDIQEKFPLIALKIGEEAAIVTRDYLQEKVQCSIKSMHPDLLFSPLGCCDLARVTLPSGFGIWGPSWLLFGDSGSMHPSKDVRVKTIPKTELSNIDQDVFWHTEIVDSISCFGIYEDGLLVALATVCDKSGSVWEIGMDVSPDAKGGGLGHAVVATAADWILENDKIVMASVGPFNVPSARTLRSVGLQYLMSNLQGVNGSFRVPPQQLGQPDKNTPVYNYYPQWAMNQSILPREAD